MSKYITHFQTESEYQAALPSIELPNVSLVDELGEVHYHRALYGAHAGDICLYDVAEGQKFFVTANDWNLTSYPTASYPIVGIAIADEGVSGVTLVSTLYVASDGSQTTTDTKLRWQNTGFDWGLTKYLTNETAITDFNGKTNTSTIIAAIKAYDLANSTDNITGNIPDVIVKYAPTGTVAGDWYIGSEGESYQLFKTNKTVISSTLDTINSVSPSLSVNSAKFFNNDSGNNKIFNASTEQNINYHWFINTSYAEPTATSPKTDASFVRPFLKLT